MPNPVLYELWLSDSEGCHTFVPAAQRAPDLPSDARLIWTCEARDWEDAQRKKHEFLGWEPYVSGDEYCPQEKP